MYIHANIIHVVPETLMCVFKDRSLIVGRGASKVEGVGGWQVKFYPYQKKKSFILTKKTFKVVLMRDVYMC